MESEFVGILDLPEEKVVDICNQMDDITLAKFLKVSKDTRRICDKVLKDRESEYNGKINILIDELKKNPGTSFRFKSLYSDSIFYMKYIGGSFPFMLTEIILKPIYIFEKLKLMNTVKKE